MLEYFHPRTGWDDVGGLDQLKHWLKNRGRAFTSQAKGLRTREPPRGITSWSTRLWKESDCQGCCRIVEISPSTFRSRSRFGGIVGESEANMRKALQVAQAISPCILWIDEIGEKWRGLKALALLTLE